MQGPGQVPTMRSRRRPTVHHRQRRRPADRGSAVPTRRAVTIQGDADILVVTLGSGYGEVHDQGYGLSTTLDDSQPHEAVPQGGRLQVSGRHPGGVGVHHAGHRADLGGPGRWRPQPGRLRRRRVAGQVLQEARSPAAHRPRRRRWRRWRRWRRRRGVDPPPDPGTPGWRSARAIPTWPPSTGPTTTCRWRAS